MGVVFTSDAVKRIRAAVLYVESRPQDRTGDRAPAGPVDQDCWGFITGCDASGQRYSFARVYPDASSDSPDLILDNGMKFKLFDADPSHVWQAREVNDTRGISSGTIVKMSFAGYDGSTPPEPLFLFQYIAVPPQPDFTPIHDHRDNFNGGFAFAVYAPGTSLPQQKWHP